uniref:Uncharacterized protein n=1 Tax=Oryza nivara TaxID=4536 RepID=A0A0E0ITK7_ORYNI
MPSTAQGGHRRRHLKVCIPSCPTMTPDDMAAACLMKCPVRSSIRGLNLQWGNEHQMNMHLNIVQIDCYMYDFFYNSSCT